MYGHVDNPAHWLGHLRTLARIQDETGGFTEFVALPFIHTNAAIYLAGVARPGPTPRENRAVHAMARILLHGRIGNIPCSWVKLGVDGSRDVLRGDVNDLGGTLMEETISRTAGSQHGRRRRSRSCARSSRRCPTAPLTSAIRCTARSATSAFAASGTFTGVLRSLAELSQSSRGKT